MTWTRRTLRMWSALCAALLLYGAIPHSHGGGHSGPHSGEHGRSLGSDHTARVGAPAPTGDRLASGVAAEDGVRVENGVLVADDAHESHSPSLALDGHPCALCRDKSSHALAAVHAAPPRLDLGERSPRAPDAFARRPELLLAERHPARAPPLA